MIGTKKLLKMARKWMKVARIARKRISSPNNSEESSSAVTTSTSSVAKGHFVVYTSDGKRFSMPLAWLSSDIFGELLKIAKEEFDLPGDGPITMPFEASFMEEVTKLLKRCGPKHLKVALLSSIADRRCSTPISDALTCTNHQQQLLACYA